jgi:putative tricarboxylic transport membrane protein
MRRRAPRAQRITIKNAKQLKCAKSQILCRNFYQGENKMLSLVKRTLAVVALIALFTPAVTQAQMAKSFPSKPMELICTTRPSSSVAVWCHVMAKELSKVLGKPMQVIFKSGGSQHEPVLYVTGKPADGLTLMHTSASFYGYFHLPHYKKSYADFTSLAQVEKHVYGVAVRCDNKYGIKTYEDLVKYAKANPNKLAMGSNKIGSNHHRHQLYFMNDAGIKMRFVPFRGDGNTVKSVMSGELAVGMASPRTWRPHITAGTACPLVMLSEKRLHADPQWANVRNVREVGLKYEVKHHWQGFFVKRGTPVHILDKLSDALVQVVQGKVYQEYLKKGTHIEPALRIDRDWLKADQLRNMPPVKQFLMDNKVIPSK